jgi:hypothetical protein
MTALTKSRLTAMRLGTTLMLAVAANVLCFDGALAVVDAAGHVKPGVTGTGLRGIGKFRVTADNSAGAAGDVSVEVEVGIYQYANSAGADAVTAADIGKPCFVVDDQTVARTSNGGARSIAGRIADVDADGVWVDFTAPTSLNKLVLQFRPVSVKASDAAVVRVVSPVAGSITRIRSVSNEALATGDATLTGKIGATAITGGVITIAQAGSAAGDVDEATPTANNTVVPGSVISLTGGGASTATGDADCLVEISL